MRAEVYIAGFLAAVLTVLPAWSQTGEPQDDLCRSSAIIQACAATCQASCNTVDVALEFPEACKAVYLAENAIDSPECDALLHGDMDAINAEPELPPGFPGDDGFPTCTTSFPAMQQQYGGLVERLGDSLKLYEPILESDIESVDSLERVCSYTLDNLFMMYKRAISDNQKIADLDERINKANQCFQQLREWVNNLDLPGLNEGSKLRDDLVKNYNRSFEELASTRAELMAQLVQIKEAEPALRVILLLHRRSCPSDPGASEGLPVGDDAG